MSCCDGFRLSAPSKCSLQSKARIDALFGETRSVCSSSWTAAPTRSCCNLDPEDNEEDDRQQRRVNSAVQARIEAMFAKVEAESATASATVLPVKYMGAALVGGRVASVRGLQEPLRQLSERIGSSVNAELEVSRRGLTFRTSDLHEKNNPFRRIAVWSALKLQAKRRLGSNSNTSMDYLYAFVPLVADSSVTSNSEDRHAELYRAMRGLDKDVEDYPPIFAVVMRRPGAARVLECHAFACRCDEDAIAAAATLYRALLADLDANARRPRQKNGLGCVSLASVVSCTSETSPVDVHEVCNGSAAGEVRLSVPAPPPPPLPPPSMGPPVRPPRIKKSSMSSSAKSEDDQSTSSNCVTNICITGESPRLTNNSLENIIQPENVLDARSRLMSPTRIDENEIYEIRAENNLSPASSRLEQANEERRMNAKNKIYGVSRVTKDPPSSSSPEVQVIEKIYDDRKPRTKNIEVFKENEKLTSDRERSNLYGFNCCHENSVYESSRIYAKSRLAGYKCKTEHKIFDVPHASGRRSVSSSSLSSRDRRPEELVYAQHQRRRGSSDILERPDPFRDVDKIYRLEEICGRDGGIYNLSHVNRQSQHPRSDNSDNSARTRLSRVSTMDRPLRSSPSSSVSQPQQRQQLQLPAQTRQRRRSRAGSEPPSTRTEAAIAKTVILTKRSQSELELADRGDLMTRVELPRRSSFLKPGSVRKREGPGEDGGRTPLGFSELFDEFRNQEGLTSVDDILAAIIDPEGMSFNDLKPLYKEFLLKLAATLTQDELYQRSASIMRRRRRPQRRRSSRNLLRRAIKRSVSRLRSGTSNAGPTEFTSVLFPARRLNERNSFGSSSSCDAMKMPGHKHGGSRVIASKVSRRRNSTRCSSSKSRPGCTTSEDSDTCRRMGRSMLAANRSSSGYVSCSECSYDSESCTCVSADKCYCSLSRKTPQESIQPVHQAPMIPCGCDTDSCSESNKCYCARNPTTKQPSILEQLRQKGIVPAESTLSRGGSPERRRSRRASKNLTTSKSLEYLKVRSTRNSTDNLALDYDLFKPVKGDGRRSQCSSSSEKVLVVSARDPQGRLIYVGGAGAERAGVGRDGRRASRHCREGRNHHEALSIKKSAEIAAVFTGNGNTRLGRRSSSTSSIRSSLSLEAALGYFP